MKNILLPIILCLAFNSRSQTILLPKECKFIQGDNKEWANPAFNDNDWISKQLGQSWAAKDSKPNVYAWYRIKINIPSSIKESAEKNNGIKLSLGKIDDIDQTFFNGKLIGETGSFPPNYLGQWDRERHYIIPVQEVEWDKENLIAVRIFSPDFGGVGMYAGPYTIEPIGWPDFIDFKESIVSATENAFTTKIKFTKKREYNFNGHVKYWIKNKAGKELFTDTKQIQLSSVTEKDKTIVFAEYHPIGDDFFNIGYQITENNSSVIIEKEQFYLANTNIEIPVGKSVQPLIKNKIEAFYTPALFQDQQFNNSYLGKRMTQNLVERLLKVDEEGLMGSYLSRPGIHPWAGEHVGKYLEAACNVWKNTHDARLKKQMDRMMYQLINSQLEDGYLGTYTSNDYWTSWDVWSHKYNLHGLLAYYSTTGYTPALEASRKMGDLLCRTFGKNAGQKDIITAGEHMGMAATSVLDAMVELYRFTADKKYLDFCYYILNAWEQDNGPKIISRLLQTGNVAKVGNGKAYEMISNFVGLTKLYSVTGDEKLLQPVLIAWQNIVEKKLYITGTTSSWEYFQDDFNLPAAEKDHMGEGCVTTTWIQFNQNLFAITGDFKYYDEIEKAIYNHLLAAENPQTGCVSYYTPLMSKKPYTCYITCCQSSVPRGIALIPNFTFGSIKNIPTLLMYEPAVYKENIITADNKTINLSLQVESNFPENGNVVITVITSQPATFSISLRVPSWSSAYTALIDGKTYKGKTGQNITINRGWKTGEKIKVTFQMPVKILEGGVSYPGQIALQRGPQVLALDSALNVDALKKYSFNSKAQLVVRKPYVKKGLVLLPGLWVGKQVYALNIAGEIINEKRQQLILVPFADASQTGGAIKVWMPLKLMNK